MLVMGAWLVLVTQEKLLKKFKMLSKLKIFAQHPYCQVIETLKVEFIHLLKLTFWHHRHLLLPLQLLELLISTLRNNQLPKIEMERMCIYMSYGLQKNKFGTYNWTQLNLRFLKKLTIRFRQVLKDGINLILKNQFILNGIKSLHISMTLHSLNQLIKNYLKFRKLKMPIF